MVHCVVVVCQPGAGRLAVVSDSSVAAAVAIDDAVMHHRPQTTV